MPKITLTHVSKRFDSFVAVDDLNMVIEDREFITLLGPSGCGKTTTLRMIAGLETPTEGRITIGDTVVFDSEAGINISPAKRDIGFLFQNYALWPHMTVYQNIAFGLENLKWGKAEIRERVDEMLAMLKIEEFEKRYPSELSGGQQQRVAIARTLAPEPKVLFMDEPLSNLDAKLRLEMRTELKRLHADTDSTFVYVTHDQLEAMTLATRICLIKTGVLQQYDPPLTVYNDPANLFVADFVGNPTMNFIPASAQALEEGWEKILVILTRKSDYRKKYRHFYMLMIRLLYHRYPAFVRTVAGRAQKYNQCLKNIEEMEKQGKALVLRPSKLAISNNESDVGVLMDYYQHGYEEAMGREEEIWDFLN